MIRRFTAAFALIACISPAAAFGQSVLILDDTNSTTEAQDAAERLGFDVVATRSNTQFQSQYETREEWDLIVVDIARLVFTSALLAPIEEHLDNGGPVLASYGNMDGNAAVRDAFGLVCAGDPATLSLASTPENGYDIFNLAQNLPSPLVGRRNHTDNGDRCNPVGAGLTLAREGDAGGAALVVTSRDNQVMYTGIVYDSLRAADTDVDSDGLNDVSELIENQIVALLDMQTPALVVYADAPTPEIDAWSGQLELEVLRPADVAELDALMAEDDYYALYISVSDLAAADPALQTTITTARSSETPVLFFSSDFDASVPWADFFGITTAVSSDTAADVVPGASGLLRTLFNQPNPVAGLAVAADGVGDSRDEITDPGTLEPVGVFSDGGTAVVADLAGGLIVGSFLPAEVGLADADADTISEVSEFFENAVAFSNEIGGPFALLLSDAAANGLESEMDEAARRMGWFPLQQLDAAEADATLSTTDIAIILVENVGEDTAPFDSAALIASVDEWVDDNPLVVAAANLDALTDWQTVLGVTVDEDFSAPRTISRDPTNLGRLFAIPSRIPDDLAGATSTLTDYGDELTLAEVGAVVARYPTGGAAIATTHNMNVVVSAFALQSVGQEDTDSDRLRDIQQLLIGQMTAVTSPQTSLVLDDDAGRPSIFGEAAQRTGLRAEVVTTPAAFAAAYDTGEYQQIAIDSSAGDSLVDAEAWARVLDWTSETRGMTLAFTNFDEYPEAATYFGFDAIDTTALNNLVESSGDTSEIFRSPALVPNPISRGPALYPDSGDELTPTGDATVAARYLFNLGPIASVLSFSGTVAVNSFAPRELADSDLDSDGIVDRVALFTNEMIRTGRVPVPVLGGPYELTEGGTITLDASASFDPFDETLEFGWDLDDDGDYDDGSLPTVNVSGAGVDGPSNTSASLRIRNESGLTAIAVVEIPIVNVPPTINAGSNRTVNQGAVANFSVSIDDVPDDTHLVTWDFGTVAGDTDVGESVSFSYTELGVYTVTVTVTDDDLGEATASFDVTYQNVAPTIDIGSYGPIDEGQSIDVTATVADAGGDPIEVTWDFGDGGATADGVTASRLFTDNGTFTIRATATDDNGGERSDSTNLIVRNVAPIITSDAPLVVEAEGSYEYDMAVTDPGDDEITYELTVAPEGMTVSATGEIRWTPGAIGFEDVPMLVTVRDGDGGTATEEWTIAITFGDSDLGGAPNVCEVAYGFDPDDGDDDLTDPDEDGLTVADECIAGSDPTVFSGPAAPVPLSPVDNETWNQPFLELVTQNSADPDGDFVSYDFQLYSDEELTELIEEALGVEEVATGETLTTFDNELTEDTIYYWRVRGVATDVTGPWSEAASFIFNQRNAPPGRPTAIAPVEYAAENPPVLRIMNAVEPEFETVVYDFEVFNGTTTRDDLRIFLAEDVVEGDGGETSVAVDVELEENSRYTWRARARDLSGGVGPYEVVTFLVDVNNEPPPAPEIVGPDAEELLPIGGAVTLEWRNSADPDGDRVDYLGDVATDEDFTEIVRSFRADRDPANSTTAVVVPVTLEAETTYYWRVAATDSRFVSEFDFSTFQTAAEFRNTAPTAPTPVAPLAGGSFDVGDAYEFIVDNAVDPDETPLTYQFQIAFDVNMRTLEDCPPVNQDTGCADDGSYCCEGSTVTRVPEGTDTTSIIHPDLRPINYFWRARAFDGVTSGPWSEVSGFTIDEDFVFPDPDTDTDAGDVGDAGVDVGAEVGPSGATRGQLGGGGGCTSANSSSPVAAFFLLGLLGIRRRRR